MELVCKSHFDEDNPDDAHDFRAHPPFLAADHAHHPLTWRRPGAFRIAALRHRNTVVSVATVRSAIRSHRAANESRIRGITR